ncbi:MAG: hypothetical protein ABIK82_12645 [Pseudomonadota bacterium]
MVTFRFGVTGNDDEDFLASTDDAAAIKAARDQLALPEEKRKRHLTGRIVASQGDNLHWRWRFVDSSWQFADISMEVCDAVPSYVEAHLDEWLGQGRFCPWACHVKGEVSGVGER